ncbi:hypothetical protein P3T23_002285 [Paraburkholderia sp. GAS448]
MKPTPSASQHPPQPVMLDRVHKQESPLQVGSLAMHIAAFHAEFVSPHPMQEYVRCFSSWTSPHFPGH